MVEGVSSRVGSDADLCFCKGSGCCVGVEGSAGVGRGRRGMCGGMGVEGGSQE